MVHQGAANVTALATEDNLRAIRAAAQAIGSARRTLEIRLTPTGDDLTYTSTAVRDQQLRDSP
ncbi:hypothetical protein [Streptomyces sp. DT195]|uniref:hypothetical protein n=1 Tax=Streptomyces sp. DT195 TaxID=3393419 RepID=UPI003CEC86A0